MRSIVVSLLVLFLSAPERVEARLIERIVAVINREIVLLSELLERTASFEAQLEGAPPGPLRESRLAEVRKQALTQIIDEKLIAQEARKLKIEVQEDELDKAVQQVMHRNNLSEEQLAAALQQEGKSVSAYKQEILRPQLMRLKVLNVQVRSRINVQDDEIKALYQQNLRSLGVETRVRARHIFIHLPDQADRAQRAARKERARELLRKLEAGADFGALAREHSEDSVTRDDGGDLGFFTRGTLPANVEDVVFALKKGEVRGPLLSERGYHIVQVTDREDSSARPYKEVREQLRDQLYNEKMEKATRTWLSDVRKRSFIDLRL